MAGRRYGRRARRYARKHPIKVLSLAIPIAQAAVAWTSTGDALNAVDQFQSYYTGFVFMHKAWRPGNLLIGWGPWAALGFAKKFARPLGLIPKSPIPGVSLS